MYQPNLHKTLGFSHRHFEERTHAPRLDDVSRSEEFHLGDSLNVMWGEIESTLDQIELNIGKSENIEQL